MVQPSDSRPIMKPFEPTLTNQLSMPRLALRSHHLNDSRTGARGLLGRLGSAGAALAVLGALSLPCSPVLSQTAAGQAAEGKPAKTASAKTKANKTNKAAKPKKAVRPATKATAAAGAAGAAVVALIGTGPAYAERAEAMEFADELARQHQLPKESLRQTLGRARQSPQVITLMQPATAPFVKNWRVYRSRFLDSWRIQAGLAFWQQHHKELARAESVYGVPAEIIVGVLGVETIYGREMGRFRVIDALSTLAFDFPAAHPRAAERSDYFRKELAQFLLAQNRLGLDPFKALGSYAGASGIPQFMPSSIATFAVDFDGDGRIDLRGSVSDAIGSVARYMQAYGWKTGMPTHYPVLLKSEADMATLLAPDILPTFSLADFQSKGAALEGPALAHRGPLALIELLNGKEPPSFVAGTENFYVITRYNWSSYYAMAVIDLGAAVAQRMQAKP